MGHLTLVKLSPSAGTMAKTRNMHAEVRDVLMLGLGQKSVIPQAEDLSVLSCLRRPGQPGLKYRQWQHEDAGG